MAGALPEPPTVLFAHPAYQLAASFAKRRAATPHRQVWTAADAEAHLEDADVLVLSGFWCNEWLTQAPKLKYVHVCAAGYDQYDQRAFADAGVLLANSSGVNVNAVSDHAMALLLGLTRQIHLARDRQARAEWRATISEIGRREDELDGKTLVIYGLGGIGGRLARLAGAFGMRVLGVKRDTGVRVEGVEALYPPERFTDLLAEADVVALTCPLTDETRGLIDAEALGRMKETAYLINVARGPVVDEAALVEALQSKGIAGAGLDVFDPEPLPAESPLWSLENALITPHTGGETRRYEENVVDFLCENLDRLAIGDADLVNRIV
ncbi:MAG: D-2-hydroxyacid dehydrogenase [Magnetovibrio sp.]|nr:D-2-hydroxyacid dehydrogenase [Magnetovibrio sp.]